MTLKSYAQDVAKKEVEQVRAVTTDGVKSGAYLYPLRGILYFATHRSLWKPLASRLLPTITLAVSILAGMFTFTYVPQVAVLAFFDGPLAPVTTALLVLSESSALLNMLARNFVIEDALLDTFDGTLVAKGCESVLTRGGREVKRGGVGDAISKLGKTVKKPLQRFSPAAFIRYLMYLPLNFIPVVGTFVFIILQGKRFGPAAHERYFQLKRLSASDKAAWIEKRRGAYTGFGVPATLLEMIPIGGLFFVFTNTCGAALWAADMEKENTTAPELQDAARKAE